MKVMSTSLLAMEKKVATMGTEKELLTKSSAEILSSATRKVTESAHTEESFIGIIFSMYSGFALHIEKTIISYCCRDVYELVHIMPKEQRSWRRRGENVQKLKEQREN